MDPIIETAEGKLVNVYEFTADDYDVSVVASSLSKICRYNGHCSRLYTVAEHAFYVATFVMKHLREEYVHVSPNPLEGKVFSEYEITLAGLCALHHDDAEAYIGDVITPLKTDEIRILEDDILIKVYRALGIEGMDDRFQILIARMDNVLLATEARDLMDSGGQKWVGINQRPLPKSELYLGEDKGYDHSATRLSYLNLHGSLMGDLHKLRTKGEDPF